MSMLVLLFSFSQEMAPTPVLYSQQLLAVGSVTLPALCHTCLGKVSIRGSEGRGESKSPWICAVPWEKTRAGEGTPGVTSLCCLCPCCTG